MESEGFAVCVMRAEQADVSIALAKSGEDTFKRVVLGTSPGGPP